MNEWMNEWMKYGHIHLYVSDFKQGLLLHWTCKIRTCLLGLISTVRQNKDIHTLYTQLSLSLIPRFDVVSIKLWSVFYISIS